jgi:outer membrane protein OmpA-like peptidoglycan-associated protein
MISFTSIRAPSALLTAAVALALVSCASTPRQDAALASARSAVTIAHNDPQVVGGALEELTIAETALNSADAMLAAGRPLADVDHQAYLADRYAKAAQQHGQLLASTAAIADLDNRRNQVLLAARERDAHRANVRADAMTIEADSARLEAAASAIDTHRATVRADAMTIEADSARHEAAASAIDTAVANGRADRLDAQLTELQGRRTDRGVVVTLGDVLFETNRSQLQEGSQRSLARLTSFLSSHPTRTIRVEGFTDNVGSDVHNRDLSDRRAYAVADALARGGVGRDRIQTEGYGNAYPVASNGTSIGRQQNRRVEVVISDSDQRIAERTE